MGGLWRQLDNVERQAESDGDKLMIMIFGHTN